MVKQRTPTEEHLSLHKQIFTCPHCGERISMLLDPSTDYQRYIEDCEVCCNQIEISYQAEEGRIVSFQAGIP
jgi:transcription elongation factor Elf1